MRVKSSRIFRLLASLFAALTLVLGGAGIANATSTSDLATRDYYGDCRDGRGGDRYRDFGRFDDRRDYYRDYYRDYCYYEPVVVLVLR